MPKIKKSTIVFTFLHPADAVIHDWSIDEINHECDCGDFVGGTREITSVDVPDDQIETELQALGSDGSFFEHLFENA